MKNIKVLILLAGFTAAVPAWAQPSSAPVAASKSVITNAAKLPPAPAAPDIGSPPAAAPIPAPSANEEVTVPPAEGAKMPDSSAGTNVDSSAQAASEEAASPTFAPSNGTNALHLNFRGASLD